MKLFTPVEIPRQLLRLDQSEQLLVMGSCFATEMGERLRLAKFPCCLNPYGVLYNPASIFRALDEIISGKTYTPSDLIQTPDGLWHSLMHHGSYSSARPQDVVDRINRSLACARQALDKLDVLILTFGTSYVYRFRETRQIVGNCHKLPERSFDRSRLAVTDFLAYTSVLDRLIALRPRLQILLTVSPIRHVRDGLHENQLSKATLLLLTEELKQRYPQSVKYFPAYELLLDELRDYRFYADDLVHPASIAIDYIWQRFSETCFSTQALEIMQATDRISKDLNHRPLHPDSETYKRFLEQIVLNIERLNEKYPYLEFSKEIELCHTLLKKFQNS